MAFPKEFTGPRFREGDAASIVSFPDILFLTSNDGTQQGRSGYDVLADYFPPESSRIVRYKRSHPKGPIERVWRKIVCRGAATSWYMLSSRRLEKMAMAEIGQRRPQLVHHLWGNRDWGFIHQPLAQMGIPFVATIHNCPPDMAQVYHRPEALEQVSAFILMSHSQRAFFESQGVPADRIHVVWHGIDVEYFKPLAEPPVADGTFTVLSVGQTQRNFPALLALVESLQDTPGIEFRIISKPDFQKPFARFNNVRFESGISNEALLTAYQTAGVQILTAEDATANNALLEGIACGLPIVGEAVGGIPEYCGPDSAILTAPNDIPALRAGILEMRDHAAERARRSQAARERALELKWEYSVETLRQLFWRLIEETKP